MKLQSIKDPSFARYGKCVEGYEFSALIREMREGTPCPAGEVVYLPDWEGFKDLPLAEQLQSNFYGGMPIQLGYCNGENKVRNSLEYHRGCEINIAADTVVLLLADSRNIKQGKLDTSQVEAFELPAGEAVMLYETCLHYAPCCGQGMQGFRVCIVLPKGTNTEKPLIQPIIEEDKMLWAKNKWLMAHPDSPEAKQGAYIGLTGKNIEI